MMPFFCKRDGDFDLEPTKKTNRYGFWYEARCPKCDTQLMRYQDPKQDPYYKQSKRVIMMRDKYRTDIIQYGEEGFSMYYKKQYDEFEKQREEYEQKQSAKKKEFDKFYDKIKYETQGNTQVMRKMVSIEEKLNNG